VGCETLLILYPDILDSGAKWTASPASATLSSIMVEEYGEATKRMKAMGM